MYTFTLGIFSLYLYLHFMFTFTLCVPSLRSEHIAHTMERILIYGALGEYALTALWMVAVGTHSDHCSVNC
jgi:hypothetical protein